MDLSRTHTRHFLYFHLVWTTKNRESLITGEVESLLYPYLSRKARHAGGRLLALNGVGDHVHLVVQLTPRQSLSKFVKDIKGSSSHFLNHDPRLINEFKWQAGYGAFTVSEQELPAVMRYVKFQKKHHAAGDTIAAWEYKDSEEID